MALLPDAGANMIEVLSGSRPDALLMPSKTWRIDFERGRISGTVDRQEAMPQAILLMLLVPRYRHVIYSRNYGSELDGVIGKDREIVEVEIARITREALMADDRMRAVENVTIAWGKDEATVSFDAVTVWGTTRREVSMRV